MENIRPIEETNPYLADVFMDIAQKKYRYGIKSIQQVGDDFVIIPAPMINDIKVGRNDPCHCGSGKKYKKCCGKE